RSHTATSCRTSKPYCCPRRRPRRKWEAEAASKPRFAADGRRSFDHSQKQQTVLFRTTEMIRQRNLRRLKSNSVHDELLLCFFCCVFFTEIASTLIIIILFVINQRI